MENTATVVAVFKVDRDKLNEMEGGSIENAFGWVGDSGLYLEEYETYENGEQIPDIIKR